MNLGLMTYPSYLKGEIDLINMLLMEGLSAVHLRKPNESELYVERFIHAIPEQFRNRIWLYDYHRIGPKYGVHSIHFTYNQPPTFDAIRWKCEKSMTLHNLDEIFIQDKRIKSIVVGPLFTSVDEQEKKIRFEDHEMEEAIENFRLYTESDIHAIGGVDHWNIEYLEDYGFDSAILFSAFWKIYRQNGKEQAVQFFRDLQTDVKRRSTMF